MSDVTARTTNRRKPNFEHRDGTQMGVYYKVACDEAKESIDPGVINDLGVKAVAIAHPKHMFGPVVIFAMLNRWSSPIRLVDDIRDDPGYFDYADVTEEVLRLFNETYKTDLRFTGLVSDEATESKGKS